MTFATVPPDQIDAWVVALPLRRGFSSARSRLDERHLLLVRVKAEEIVGWGEVAPVPGHSQERISDIWRTLRRLAIDAGLATPAASTGMLAAAFNQASDDLAARRAGQPLWAMLGGTNEVTASAAIGVDRNGQPDTHQVAEAAGAGYRHVKLKVTPRTDPTKVAGLIADFPEIRFGVDANGSLGLTEQALLAALDNLDLAYIEQPGAPEDLDLHGRLRHQLRTPIALDEAAASIPAIDRILATAAADIVNLKTGRFGTSATLELAERIVAAGLRVRLGGLIESGIGRAHTVALAAHPIFELPGDIAGSDRYFADDLVRPQWRVTAGRLTLPTGIGIGVAVAEAAIEAHTVETLSIG